MDELGWALLFFVAVPLIVSLLDELHARKKKD
jgi:hypothetical protein